MRTLEQEASQEASSEEITRAVYFANASTKVFR